MLYAAKRASKQICICVTVSCSWRLAQPRNLLPTNSLCLVHLADQSIDLVFTVTSVTALNIVLELPRAEASGWAGKFKRPDEIVGLFELYELLEHAI